MEATELGHAQLRITPPGTIQATLILIMGILTPETEIMYRTVQVPANCRPIGRAESVALAALAGWASPAASAEPEVLEEWVAPVVSEVLAVPAAWANLAGLAEQEASASLAERVALAVSAARVALANRAESAARVALADRVESAARVAQANRVE